jgi:hypothetical protein
MRDKETVYICTANPKHARFTTCLTVKSVTCKCGKPMKPKEA